MKSIIFALLLSFVTTAHAGEQAKFDSSKYLYAAPVILDDAGLAQLTISNMAFRAIGEDGLVPAIQTIRLAYMYSEGPAAYVYSGDLVLLPGATVAFNLREFFGSLPPGSLLVESREPIVGAVGAQPFTLVRMPAGGKR